MGFFFIPSSSSYSFSLDHPLITSGHVYKSHTAPKDKYPCLNILHFPLSPSASLHPSISPPLMQFGMLDHDWSGSAVANANSLSPAAEMNGDQIRSGYEVRCWYIGDTRKREEAERWKWGEGRWKEMNVYSGMYPLLKFLWPPGGLGKHFNS